MAGDIALGLVDELRNLESVLGAFEFVRLL